MGSNVLNEYDPHFMVLSASSTLLQYVIWSVFLSPSQVAT